MHSVKKHKAGKLRRSTLMDILLIVIFALLTILTIYPFWYCIMGSLMSYGEFIQTTVLLWPKKFTLEAYSFVFSQGKIVPPMLTTVRTTIIGTVINLFLTTWVAYGMSKKYPGDTAVTLLVVVSMFLNPGLIPNYMLFRKLRLLNTIWVYIVPYLVNTFYLIILRTNFANFSHELEEAASIDGAGVYRIFFTVVLPLSKPILATIALFTAVDYWNTYQQSVYFVSDANLKTLQDYLYMMPSNNNNNAAGVGIAMTGAEMGKNGVYSENIKLANTVVAVLPILIVYPFLQKYFTNGIMVGALKG